MERDPYLRPSARTGGSRLGDSTSSLRDTGCRADTDQAPRGGRARHPVGSPQTSLLENSPDFATGGSSEFSISAVLGIGRSKFSTPYFFAHRLQVFFFFLEWTCVVFIYFILTSKVKCNILLGSGVQRDDLFLYACKMITTVFC